MSCDSGAFFCKSACGECKCREGGKEVVCNESKLCSLNGGNWKVFPDGCADKCGNMRQCTEAFVESCDCGEDKCWNGNSCIED
ncbi:MAG: hypothetical protein KKE23_03965 [Nanoarchaeota archaeon]|nr:hypothetical protein [Nanoarchaeota archaeon]